MFPRIFCLFGTLLAVSSAFGEDLIVGIDPKSATDYFRSNCKSNCEIKSILPITNRFGNAATCVSSSSDNYQKTNNNGLYYVYAFNSTCAQRVFVSTKVGGKWHANIGDIKPNTPISLSVLYPSGNGNPPSVVLFCNATSEPLDERTCAGSSGKGSEQTTPSKRTNADSETPPFVQQAKHKYTLPLRSN